MVFDQLCEAGLPHTVVEIARENFRRTGEVLATFVALLCPERLREPSVATVDDEFPPEVMVREFPGWAYDVYSREGRRALEAFLAGRSETARWVRAHIPGPQRVRFVGDLVFRVEGHVCRSRLRWSVGDELRRVVDRECNGLRFAHASEVLDLTRSDLPLLNEVRAEVC